MVTTPALFKTEQVDPKKFPFLFSLTKKYLVSMFTSSGRKPRKNRILEVGSFQVMNPIPHSKIRGNVASQVSSPHPPSQKIVPTPLAHVLEAGYFIYVSSSGSAKLRVSGMKLRELVQRCMNDQPKRSFMALCEILMLNLHCACSARAITKDVTAQGMQHNYFQSY